MSDDLGVVGPNTYFNSYSTLEDSNRESSYKNRIRNLNEVVSVLAGELDLDKLDKGFKNNIEGILEEHYSDKIKSHESYINSLKVSIAECESNIDSIKNLGGVAGDELIKSYNDYKDRLSDAKNIKEKDLRCQYLKR